MSKAHFGLIGLGVMGENLVLNAERNGFSSVVYNRTYAKTEDFLSGRGAGLNIVGAHTLEEFVGALERPRRILMMIKAGEPIDAMIATLSPLLEDGDLLIDGGNSLYTDTERRVKELESKSFGFIGMGVSGGAKGALEGPSMMPGGTKSAYDAIEGLGAQDGCPGGRWPLRHLHRPRWRWALRQDGAQRHRIRHRADPLRGL